MDESGLEPVIFKKQDIQKIAPPETLGRRDAGNGVIHDKVVL